MPLVPRPPLVVALAVPVVLSVLALADDTLVAHVWLVDLAIWGAAFFDAALVLGARVHIERRPPRVFSLGRPNTVQILVRSMLRRRVRVRIEQELFDHATSAQLPLKVPLRAGASKLVTYSITPRRRGSYVLGDHFVRIPSPFGLWWRQRKISDATPVRVYPDLQSVRTYELLAKADRQYGMFRSTRLRGGESEFERLREYTRDDEYRKLDWKATARRNQLIVRTFQLESNQNVVFMLDAGRLMSATSEDVALFDHALNAALMLGHIAVGNGDNVGLLGFSDTVHAFVPPSRGKKANQRVIHACYDLHPRLVEPDFALAFDHIGQKLRRRSLLVLFTQVTDDVTARLLVRRARGLSARHLPLIVLLRDESVAALATPESPADLYTKGAAAEMLRWREKVIFDLRASGANVLDVAAGQLTAALLNRYLHIKVRHLL